MFLVKVLENKKVLRAFGAALILAPIVNTLVKMALLPELPNLWSLAMFWRIIAVGSAPNKILYAATILIGFLMLRGSAAAWKYVLFLLGGYIALQISDFKHVKSSAVTWLFFITNILAFMFVADQLVWKVKSAPPTPKLKPAPKLRRIPEVRKRILLQFKDQSPWGHLLSVSSQGIQVRQLVPPPPDLATREVEIFLSNDLVLRAHLSHRQENDYFFKYSNMTATESQSLHNWLHSLSMAA